MIQRLDSEPAIAIWECEQEGGRDGTTKARPSKSIGLQDDTPWRHLVKAPLFLWQNSQLNLLKTGN